MTTTAKATVALQPKPTTVPAAAMRKPKPAAALPVGSGPNALRLATLVALLAWGEAPAGAVAISPYASGLSIGLGGTANREGCNACLILGVAFEFGPLLGGRPQVCDLRPCDLAPRSAPKLSLVYASALRCLPTPPASAHLPFPPPITARAAAARRCR